jgi:hypothetical protein
LVAGNESPPDLGVVLAIRRRAIGELNVFHSCFYTNPRVAGSSSASALRMVTTLIAQIFPFARPNIQICDAHVVDLYQWVCARYFVGVKGADTKAKRDLSSALDRISEQITTDFQPKGPFGEVDSENRALFIF